MLLVFGPCLLGLFASASPSAADTSQADRMLALLRTAGAGKVSAELTSSVLEAHGTDLVVQQQNVSRKVSKDQYRLLLEGLLAAEPPTIVPVDGSERSRRGVEGLVRDVRPSLLWGIAHVELLQARLDAARGADTRARALAAAAPYLPGGPPPEPRISIVMGGRAGAASLPGNEIYFDVLATSFKETAGAGPYPGPEEQIAFFAHEIHHLGYGPLLEDERRQLALDPDESRIYDLLASLLAEGSATYLINARRDLAVLEKDPTYREPLSRADELLRIVASVLSDLLAHRLDAEGYEKAIAPLTGNGFHVAGAGMLAAVDRSGGLEAVLEVMRRPRTLLVAYDRAVRATKAPGAADAAWTFPDDLARRVAELGDRP
jgi:Putative zinc dependent peptidase (DUF5700)